MRVRAPNLQAPCHRGIAVLMAVVLVFALILVVAYAAEAETTAACEVDQGKLARTTAGATGKPSYSVTEGPHPETLDWLAELK